MLTKASRTKRSLMATSLTLLMLCWMLGINRIAPPVGAQTTSCLPGQTTITKKSGNGTVCNPDTEVQFFNGAMFVPALVVNPNADFFAYDTIPTTQWVALNCTRTGPDDTHFTYRTTFTLPTSFSSPSMSVQVHCDNAAAISLNGHLVGAQPDAEDPANFQGAPEVFSTSNAAFFVPGANVISFDVHNFFAGITALDFLATICFTPPSQGCVDDDPPSVSCSVAETELWPPNHDLECVGLNATVTDDCSCFPTGGNGDDDDDDDGHHGHGKSVQPDHGGGHGDDDDDDDGHHGNCNGHGDDDDDDDGHHGHSATTSTPTGTISVKVYSDEPDLDIPGSGNFSPDAKNIGLGTLRLREERSGNGDGRVYLIVVAATDASGKIGYCAKTVTVPHDQSNSSRNAVRAAATAAKNYFLANHVPPPGYVQVGTGPVRGPKQ